MSRRNFKTRWVLLLLALTLSGRTRLAAQEPPAKPPAEENAGKPANEQQAEQDSAAEKKKEPLNLSGLWHDADGREYKFTQKATIVTLRTSTGQEFKGKLAGRSLKLAHELNPQTINRKLPDWAKQELLHRLQVKIEGTVSEDGANIEANYIDYDLEADPEISRITSQQEVKKPLRFSLRRAVIYDIEVLENQSHAFYPFQKDALPNAIALRTLFVLGKNLPRAVDERPVIVSPDETIEYAIRAQASDDNADASFQVGWNKATAGLKPEQQLAIKKLDALVLNAALHKGVKPGPHSFTLSGGRGDWQLNFGGSTAQLSFVRMTSDEENDRVESVFLPEKLVVELRVDEDIPLGDVALTFGVNGQEVKLTGKPPIARAMGDSLRLYRSDPFRIVPRDEPVSAALATLTQLATRDGEKIAVRLENEGMISTNPPAAFARVADSPAHLWREALRKAAPCSANSADDQNWDALARIKERPIAGFDIRIGDHAAMLLLRDVFVKMMQAEQRNLKASSQDSDLQLGFWQMLASSKLGSTSPWSRQKVHGPDGAEVPLTNAANSEYLDSHFQGPVSAKRWALGAIREGVGNYLTLLTASLEYAKNTSDCGNSNLLALTGIGYEGVVARNSFHNW